MQRLMLHRISQNEKVIFLQLNNHGPSHIYNRNISFTFYTVMNYSHGDNE